MAPLEQSGNGARVLGFLMPIVKLPKIGGLNGFELANRLNDLAGKDAAGYVALLYTLFFSALLSLVLGVVLLKRNVPIAIDLVLWMACINPVLSRLLDVAADQSGINLRAADYLLHAIFDPLEVGTIGAYTIFIGWIISFVFLVLYDLEQQAGSENRLKPTTPTVYS